MAVLEFLAASSLKSQVRINLLFLAVSQSLPGLLHVTRSWAPSKPIHCRITYSSITDFSMVCLSLLLIVVLIWHISSHSSISARHAQQDKYLAAHDMYSFQQLFHQTETLLGVAGQQQPACMSSNMAPADLSAPTMAPHTSRPPNGYWTMPGLMLRERGGGGGGSTFLHALSKLNHTLRHHSQFSWQLAWKQVRSWSIMPLPSKALGCFCLAPPARLGEDIVAA